MMTTSGGAVVGTYWYRPTCKSDVAWTPEREYCPLCFADRPGHARCHAMGSLHGMTVFSCGLPKGHDGPHDFERANNELTSERSESPSSDSLDIGGKT